MGIAAHRRYQRRRSIGLGLLALGEGYPRRCFFAARESEVGPKLRLGMSAIPPLPGDERTSGEQAKSDATDRNGLRRGPDPALHKS